MVLDSQEKFCKAFSRVDWKFSDTLLEMFSSHQQCSQDTHDVASVLDLICKSLSGEGLILHLSPSIEGSSPIRTVHRQIPLVMSLPQKAVKSLILPARKKHKKLTKGREIQFHAFAQHSSSLNAAVSKRSGREQRSPPTGEVRVLGGWGRTDARCIAVSGEM
eukprot:764165-Hanusia_phi.AAC.4